MATTARQVDYFYVSIAEKAGVEARVLGTR